MTHLRITTSDCAGFTVLAVAGEVALESSGELREHLIDCFRAARTKIVLDLSEVTFFDSTGVSVLIGATRRAEQAGGLLRIAAPSRQVARVLDLLGLATILDVRRSVADALNHGPACTD